MIGGEHTHMVIKGTEVVEKSNQLNEMILHGATLQEKRFFCIYLAKINARDLSTRKVCFPLTDFQRIMEIGRMNIKHFQAVTNSLLCKVYNQPNEDGGYTGFTIFKRCRVYRQLGEWFVEIEASDDALPLMFNLKNRYFKYELWNALRCRSNNQITVYELLKQHERRGFLEITVEEFRKRLDIGKEYARWCDFKNRVLDSCQQALAENTDIKFTYRRGKTGRGGKWLTIIFTISKNDDYLDQLGLDAFISNLLPEPDSSTTPTVESTGFIDELEEDFEQELQEASAAEERDKICYGFDAEIFAEFSSSQLIELRDLAVNKVPHEMIQRHLNVLGNPVVAKQYATSDYIRLKIDKVRAMPTVKNFYAYLKRAVSEDFN